MNTYTFPIQKNNKMYIFIYEHIKKDILEGKLKKDEKLPSKRILAKNLNVSINTIINAYDILLLEGFIYAKEKKGYFVSDFIGYKYREKNNTINKEIINDEKYLYDFTTSNIDYSLFPKSIFNSITKDIIYNDESFYHRFGYKGSIELRNQIKNLLYMEKNIDVDINQIIIGDTTHSLINDIINLLDIKTIMVEDPGYYKKEKFLINVEYNNVDKKGFNITEFSLSKAKLGIASSFNEFPLGIKMTMDRKHEIAKYLDLENKYLIEDSFDSSFRNNGYQTTPLFNMSNNVIFLESFSRTMFPGLCISYMVLPKKLVDKYDKLFSIAPKNISSLDQMILTKFIESGKYASHVNRLRTSFLNKKKLILQNFNNKYLELISDNNYSSLLYSIDKDIDINLFKQKIKDNKIKINFINDFKSNKDDNDILIIGFSSIKLSEINNGLTILNEIINSSLKINKMIK